MTPPLPDHAARTPRDSGFTLAEMLVVLALLGVLAAWLLQGLRVSVASWRLVSERAEAGEAIADAQATLRRLLTDAYPYFAIKEGRRARVEFAGSAREVRFLGLPPASHFGSGLLGYALTHDASDGGSIRIGVDLAAIDVDRLALQERPILRGVTAIELAYWGRRAGDSAPAWHAEWTDQNELPLLIRLDATLDASVRATWPALIARPRHDADVACVWDPMTRQCRGR